MRVAETLYMAGYPPTREPRAPYPKGFEFAPLVEAQAQTPVGRPALLLEGCCMDTAGGRGGVDAATTRRSRRSTTRRATR